MKQIQFVAYVKFVAAGTIGLEEEFLPGEGSTGMAESTK